MTNVIPAHPVIPAKAGIALLFLIFLAFSCAKVPKKAGPERPEFPKEPSMEEVPSEFQPRRGASQRIVESGREYLEQGEFEKAIQTFQEAINVDSQNGVAYFYLANTLYRTHAYEDADGLLDRAATLLKPYPEWREEVVHLRWLIEQAKENKEEKTKMEQESYY